LELQDHQQARVSADHIAVAGVLSARRRLVAAGVLGAAAFCYVTGENLPVGLLPVMSASLHVSLRKSCEVGLRSRVWPTTATRRAGCVICR
jgi:hypothetical protein